MKSFRFLVLLVVLIPSLVNAQGFSRCQNEDGTPKSVFPFTKPETCRDGIFYSCEGGLEVRQVCHNSDEAYNSLTGFCEQDAEEVCNVAAVCPTNHVAGPHPNGYECEEDCVYMGMCWDNHTAKCLCKDNQNCPKFHPELSRCPHRSIAEIHCNPAVSLEVYPDIASCRHFYICIFGNRYHFSCGEDMMFSKAASSYCDMPENVVPPCGINFF